MPRGALLAALLSSLLCGASAAPAGPQETPKIVGGEVVNPPFKYPWIALLLRNGYVSCTGTLIDPNWILTAAHCTVDSPISTASVQLHRHDLAEPASAEDGIVRSVDFAVVHPSYNPDTVENDVALWRLSSPVEGVETITLDQFSMTDQVGAEAAIMGWGTTQEGGEVSRFLLEARIRLWDFDQCNTFWGGTLDRARQVCAGLPSGGIDSCQGDSGGPLILNIDSNPVQVGIVSYGNGCARPRSPGVYASVHGYLDFIERALDPNTSFDHCSNNPCASGNCFEAVDTYYCDYSAAPSLATSLGLVTTAACVATYLNC